VLLSVRSRMSALNIRLPPDRLVQLSRRRLLRHYGVARSPGLPRNGHPTLRDIRAAALSLTSLAAVTLVYARWLHVTNATTVALTFLLVVLITAATSRLRVAVVTSIASMLCFNFFFLPPLGTWTIADPQNWVALFVFLAVSLVASRLSHVARARTHEAVGRRDELARLFDLSRDVLVMTASPDAVSHLARAIGRRFDLEYVAIALPGSEGWSIATAGDGFVQLEPRQLTDAYEAAATSLEFDAYARTYAGHRSVDAGGRIVRLVPLRVGTKPIGLLAASGRPIEPGTLDALAGVVAISIERTTFLEERKTAELTRQSEELKSALLTSLGHDLRTPLTAIRVAAGNLNAPTLPAEERDEQSDLILSEVERLTRLFNNVLEMARIDAGAVAKESRWTHPSEIVAAARDQVAHTLNEHRVSVSTEPDVAVQLDGRLTASALAHLLENAAQYAPRGTLIEVRTELTPTELVIRVRDHGPGIAPADLPHVFDRFYRGTASRTRASGTGMGLWIARGLVAAEQGRVWAENRADGGAQFTIGIPVGVSRADTEATAS
jgi:two-component system sensor histidine kinase KdpD